eukprot:22051-Amphidinium_carterae.1
MIVATALKPGNMKTQEQEAGLQSHREHSKPQALKFRTIERHYTRKKVRNQMLFKTATRTISKSRNSMNKSERNNYTHNVFYEINNVTSWLDGIAPRACGVFLREAQA